jgi:hypothetical protein
MKIILFTLLSLLSGLILADPQSPKDVSDKSVQEFKLGFEVGCNQVNNKKDIEPAVMRVLCSCLISELNKSLSQTEWRKAAYFAVTKKGKPILENPATEGRATKAIQFCVKKVKSS